MPEKTRDLNAAVAFAQAATEYCRFIDGLRLKKPALFYTKLEKLLSELAYASLQLHMIFTDDEDVREKGRNMSHKQWAKIARSIGTCASKETDELEKYYKSLSDSYRYSTEEEVARTVMFSDDLADIYRDLKGGLSLWKMRSRRGKSRAIWEWRFAYENHWGHHLFRAMQTVHEIRYNLYSN
jgi:hypothetical protein